MKTNTKVKISRKCFLLSSMNIYYRSLIKGRIILPDWCLVNNSKAWANNSIFRKTSLFFFIFFLEEHFPFGILVLCMWCFRQLLAEFQGYKLLGLVLLPLSLPVPLFLPLNLLSSRDENIYSPLSFSFSFSNLLWMSIDGFSVKYI